MRERLRFQKIDAFEEYTRMGGPAGDAGAVISWSRCDKTQRQRAAQSSENVSVHKVSRSVKKESFKSTKDSMMSTTSQESRRFFQASSNDGLNSEELPGMYRTYDTGRHAGLNPEYSSRAFPTSDFAPAPAPTAESFGARANTGDSHQFPTQSFEVENQQLHPQPHHQPRRLYHQQHYHRYLQQQHKREGYTHDANFHQMHHDAYSASIDVLSHLHLASPRRKNARVKHHDDYADNPADLNLKNEDIKTFFDADVQYW